MKILHVATHTGLFRGGAVQLCRMALGQQRRGHEVCVITQDVPTEKKKKRKARLADRSSWAPLVEAGIRVRHLNYSSPWGIVRLRAAIVAGGFDVVHAHRDDALIACWLAMWGMSNKVLIAQRGTISPLPRTPGKAFRSDRVRAVVAVSESVKEALVEDGVDPAKIHVIYGSVDLEIFTPAEPALEFKRKLNIPIDAPVIGSLSAFRKAKGLHFLVQAFAKVMETHPDAYAVFLGKKVPKNVEPIVKKHGVAERCRLLEHQTEVARWLSMMNVTVVSATEREGLSGVLRESLAMGIPVISTDCAGNREIVRDRETGLLVPPGDAAALAGAMNWALDHPAEMKQMACAGRKWVEANCSIEVHAKRLEELYQSLLVPSRIESVAKAKV